MVKLYRWKNEEHQLGRTRLLSQYQVHQMNFSALEKNIFVKTDLKSEKSGKLQKYFELIWITDKFISTKVKDKNQQCSEPKF